MKPTILTTFDTMTQNLRGSSGWGFLHHVIMEPYRLISRASLTDETLASANISNYAHGIWNNSGSLEEAFYALGKVGGDDSSIEIYKYNATTESWDTLANASSSSGSLDYTKFFYFEGFLYGYRLNAVIWRFGDTRDVAANAFTDNWKTGSWTYSTQPIVVGANAYFAMDNEVYELATGGSSLSLRFTLSSDRYITSLANRGQALSVMTYSTSTRTSKELLFSLGDVTITNAYDSIDWGSGKVIHHAESNGVILAVQNERVANIGDYNDGSVKLKRSVGSSIETVHEIRGSSLSVIGGYKKVFEDALLFGLKYEQNNDTFDGICSFDSTGRMYFPFTTEYDTTDFLGVRGFDIYGNTWFVSHSSGSVIRTGSGTKYKSTAITRKIDNGDPMLTKQVSGASVYFSQMTSSSTDYVKLYYKDEDQTSWTLIGSMTGSTENSDKTRLSTVKDTNGNPLRTYKERQYKVEFIGVDFYGLRTAPPKPIKDEPYSV